MSDQEAMAPGIEVGSGEVDCPQDDCDGTLEETDDCSMCDEYFYSPCG